MMEIETRLQDALMKEELYNQNAPATRTYEFATADWMDFRRIKAEISKKNPNLSANQVERMAKTQFVVDTWEGNHQRREYDQKPGVRTFKDWIQVYNKNALRIANQRCWANVPPPDLTVDEGLVKRHHEIMQEFVDRMGIDAPASYFYDLRHDKTLRVIRDSQELAAIGKHFEKDLKMVVMPRDDFVQVGGIVVAKDNSTAMFSPEKRKEFEKEISTIALGKAAQQAIR